MPAVNFPGVDIATLQSPAAPFLLLNSQKYMFSSQGWRGNVNRYQPGSGAVYGVSEKVFISDPYWTFAPRFLFTNWTLTTATPQETNCGNTVTIEDLSIIIGGGARTRLTFNGGATGYTMPDDSEIWSDANDLIAIPPNTVCRVTVAWSVPSGTSYICTPANGISQTMGDRTETSSSSLAAKVMAGGVSTTLPTDNTVNAFMPNCMVAKGWDGRPVGLVVDSSIGQGIGTSRLVRNMFGEQGYIGIGLASNYNGAPRYPNANFAIAGGYAGGIFGAGAAQGIGKRIRAFAALPNQPFTFIYSGLGTNDANSTLSTWKSSLSTMWAAFRTAWPTAKLIQATLWPRTTSTDGFTTVANQTAVGDWAYPAGSYWGLHSWIKNNGNGNIDAHIDITGIVDNVLGGGTRGKWRVDILDGWQTTLSAGVSANATFVTMAAQPRAGAVIAFTTDNAEAKPVLVLTSAAAPFTVNFMVNVANAHASGGTVKEAVCYDGTHPGDLISEFVGDRGIAVAKLAGIFG